MLFSTSDWQLPEAILMVYLCMKVRHIEKGINPPSVNEIFFTGDYLAKGFKIGVVAGMIALTVSNLITHFLLPREKLISLFVSNTFLLA